LEEKKIMIQKMKAKIENKKRQNKILAGDVKKLRKREIEIIKRWDLDDIDLITERLKIEKSTLNSNYSKGKINT